MSNNNHRYLDIMTIRPSMSGQQSSIMTARNSTPNYPSFRGTPNPKLASLKRNGSSNFMASNNSNFESHHSTSQTSYSSMMTSNNNTRRSTNSKHTSLLVEPILLPNLQHIQVDNPPELEESCLFYPNGNKNRNIRREIETTVIKHHIIENSKLKVPKKKNKYRITPIDIYADAKGPPLVYTKKPDSEMENLLKSIKNNESKILNTVHVRI